MPYFSFSSRYGGKIQGNKNQKIILAKTLLACFLQGSFCGCLDYIKIEEEAHINESFSFPPTINRGYLSPPMGKLNQSIRVGKNCKGQMFKVPPIGDHNAQDRLHYLWLLDNELIGHQSTIEPQFRNSAIISLNIDEQFLNSHFENKIPNDFFNKTHAIEFFVSNLRYDIPESKYINKSQSNEINHDDYAYWIITFSNDPCF